MGAQVVFAIAPAVPPINKSCKKFDFFFSVAIFFLIGKIKKFFFLLKN
jgi:hypothetical protein